MKRDRPLSPSDLYTTPNKKRKVATSPTSTLNKNIFGSKTEYSGNAFSILTGEEEEIMQHFVKAKLYCLDGEWKERGIGTLRLNYPKDNEKSPRLVMRTDNVFKVILNIILFHGMHIERSQDKFIKLFAYEDKLVHLAIKVCN
ncbi:986_t:CDS:2 [Diversispora eburnea]|uniref:986_t:CDS:1 n=1 Tax=Diversispora eburnea TaxID=1213867 RepID=A0A9N8Z9I7_9GLOM|nr:986_t:CDS:2 [Diversispora eburnea]